MQCLCTELTRIEDIWSTSAVCTGIIQSDQTMQIYGEFEGCSSPLPISWVWLRPSKSDHRNHSFSVEDPYKTFICRCSRDGSTLNLYLCLCTPKDAGAPCQNLCTSCSCWQLTYRNQISEGAVIYVPKCVGMMYTWVDKLLSIHIYKRGNVCIRIYIYMYTNIFVYTEIYHMSVYIEARYVRVDGKDWWCTDRYTHIDIEIDMRKRTYIILYIDVRGCTRIYIHIYIDMHMHMHIHTHKYTHTQPQPHRHAHTQTHTHSRHHSIYRCIDQSINLSFYQSIYLSMYPSI